METARQIESDREMLLSLADEMKTIAQDFLADHDFATSRGKFLVACLLQEIEKFERFTHVSMEELHGHARRDE